MISLIQMPSLWNWFELFSIYSLVVAIFIISENRSPQSTFAWIFFFLLFPVGGLVIYFFFGRGWRAFSQEDELAHQIFGIEAQTGYLQLLEPQPTMLARIAQRDPPSFKPKLLHLVQNNANSVLTVHNRLEILQNASQKYPRHWSPRS